MGVIQAACGTELPRSKRRTFLRPVAVLAAWAALSTCGAPKPDVHAVVPPGPTAPRLEPSSATQSVASASAAPSAGSPAAASAEPTAEPAEAKLPLRSATPAKIQCETVDCDLATEICCFDGVAGRCLAKSSAVGAFPCGVGMELPAHVVRMLVQERRCDESADCQRGERCCQRTEYDANCMGGAPRWSCATQCGSFPGQLDGGEGCRNDCGDPPASHTDEVCLRGSKCAAGTCVPSDAATGSPLGGYCPTAAPTHQIACGQAQCKGAEVCCWDPKARNGRCADPNSCTSNVETVKYACLRPSDCGAGYDCYNTSGSYSFSEYGCHQERCSMSKLFDGPFLCSSLSDCPIILRALPPKLNVVAHAPVACLHGREHPAGVKVCRY